METIVLFTIILLASIVVVKKIKAELTGKGDGCACSSSVFCSSNTNCKNRGKK